MTHWLRRVNPAAIRTLNRSGLKGRPTADCEHVHGTRSMHSMRIQMLGFWVGGTLCLLSPHTTWSGEDPVLSNSQPGAQDRFQEATARQPDLFSTPSSSDSPRLVMTWVPPYAVKKCRARLSDTYEGVGMGDALTHLALQFWVPTREGGLARAGRTNETTDGAIAALRDWGRTNGVRVLLCVFNGGKTWEWSLARAGFADRPDVFIDALLAEVKYHELDGVDLDLEGKSEHQEDREVFVAFVRRLSERLHREGYQLTVDSFAYKWNAPNHSWWPDLLPLVDGLTTMGYGQTGSDAAKWRAYSFQQAAAGDHSHKLMIGLPSHQDEWQGRSLMEHLDWFKTNDGVGVSFWDAQLRSSAWRRAEVWNTLRQIRDGP